MPRKLLTFALKLAVSTALLVVLLRGIDIAEVAQRLLEINLAWIWLALIIQIVQLVLLALRWRLITQIIDATLDVGDAIRFTMVGLFFNQTLPSTVGGDGFRMWLAWRAGSSRTAAIHGVLLDRFAGLLGLFLLTLASLPSLFQLLPHGPAKWAVAGLVGLGLVVSAALVVIGGTSWSHARLLPLRLLLDLSRDIRRVTLAPRSAPKVLVLSIVIHLTTIVTIAALARAIGLPVTLEQALVVVPPMLLVSSIPVTIAGWGVREGVLLFALGTMGVASADAIGLSILFGLTLVAVGLPGGPVWLLLGSGNKLRNRELALPNGQDRPVV